MPINLLENLGLGGPTAGDLREDTITGNTSGLSSANTPTGTPGGTQLPAISQDENCPPGGLPADPDTGPGGEEPFGETNFGDLNFLAPIEEIETGDFQSGGSIREINIFDEHSFLRSNTNLFTTDTAGNSTIQPRALSSNLYSSLVYKATRISRYEVTRQDNLSQASVEEVGIDKFRVINNRFWCLEGTEQAPIQEAWVDNRNSDSFEDRKYRIFFNNGLEPSTEHVSLQFPDPQALDFGSIIEGFSIEFGNNEFDKNIPAGESFIDTNTSIPQPLLRSEARQLSDDGIALNSYTIDFEAVVRERVTQPEYLNKPEVMMKSLYRDYFRMINPEFTDECDIVDPIQKFLSSNADTMKDANASTELLDGFKNYIKLTITRPTSFIMGADLPPEIKVPNNLATTGFDKYLLEALTGYGNGRNERNYVQIADEKSPTSQQSIRTNDQFFVGFLGALRPETLSYVSGHQQFAAARATRAVDRSTEYPLKFENFDNAAQLESTDLQPSIDFAEFLNTQAASHKRKYETIFSGEKATSAIIGYKIEKRKASNNTLLQTFYIMEPPGEKEIIPIEFLDTQVKYGHSYTYRIYSLALVFGTDYEFSDSSIVDLSVGEVSFNVETRPHVRLVEAPFFQKTVSMMDLPPLPPEVSFIPDQRNPKSLSIIFNHNVGNRKEKPIAIALQDEATFSMMIRAQDAEDGIVHYYSDTISEQYEMFQMTTPPTNYSSFGMSSRRIIPTSGARSIISRSIDVELNRDYYFTFRSIEPTGISNPTPVYKLKMVSTPNGTFMVLEEYDMLTQSQRPVNLNFERGLKISPSLQQKAIKYPEGTDLASRDFALSSPELQDITLGTADESIWGKKYKFRITSKKTGRKLDINATFEQNSMENASVLQFQPDGCDPLPSQREQEQPPPRDVPEPQPDPEPPVKCIEDLPKLPTLHGKVFVKTTNTCSDGVTRVSSTISRTYNLDLNRIIVKDGRDVGLLEYAKLVDPSLAENCQCPDTVDGLIDFIPPLAYEQQKRAADDQDYIAIFHTDGHIPKNIADATVVDDFADSARNATEELNLERESVRKQQELWWTDTGDPTRNLTGIINNFADVRTLDQFDATVDFYSQYFWPTHDSAGEEINVEKRACLDKIKQVVTGLMKREFNRFAAQGLLDDPSSGPLEPIGLFDKSPNSVDDRSALEAAKEASKDSALRKLSNCPPDDVPEPTLTCTPLTFGGESVSVEESGEMCVYSGTVEIEMTYNCEGATKGPTFILAKSFSIEVAKGTAESTIRTQFESAESSALEDLESAKRDLLDGTSPDLSGITVFLSTSTAVDSDGREEQVDMPTLPEWQDANCAVICGTSTGDNVQLGDNGSGVCVCPIGTDRALQQPVPRVNSTSGQVETWCSLPTEGLRQTEILTIPGFIDTGVVERKVRLRVFAEASAKVTIAPWSRQAPDPSIRQVAEFTTSPILFSVASETVVEFTKSQWERLSSNSADRLKELLRNSPIVAEARESATTQMEKFISPTHESDHWTDMAPILDASPSTQSSKNFMFCDPFQLGFLQDFNTRNFWNPVPIDATSGHLARSTSGGGVRTRITKPESVIMEVATGETRTVTVTTDFGTFTNIVPVMEERTFKIYGDNWLSRISNTNFNPSADRTFAYYLESIEGFGTGGTAVQKRAYFGMQEIRLDNILIPNGDGSDFPYDRVFRSVANFADPEAEFPRNRANYNEITNWIQGEFDR